MKLIINAPILGHRNGQFIEVDDEKGQQILDDYGSAVTLVVDDEDEAEAVTSVAAPEAIIGVPLDVEFTDDDIGG